MEFVYEVENNLPASLCEEIITRYKKDNRKEPSLVGSDGIFKPEIRKSSTLMITGNEDWDDIDKQLYEYLKKGLCRYREYLSQLTLSRLADNIFESLSDEGYMIQEMKQNEFYDWHFDQMLDSNKTPTRLITCIWYLNTLSEDDGGCTEFWGNKKIKPKQGNLLFFPSSWSYIHRGGPIKNNLSKYTCITWLYLE